MPLKFGPSTRRRRLLPAALAAFSLPLGTLGVAAAPAGAMSMDAMPGMSMAGMNHETHATRAPAKTPSTARPAEASSPTSTAAGKTMFHVGSPTHPLLEQGAVGPLWKATPPRPVGYSSHGTFAEVTMAAQLARFAAELAGDAPVATAAAASASTTLTTAEATKRLSRSCQRLIKARAGKLGKKDRAKRAACIKKRTALMKASAKGTGTSAPTAPGVSAPAPTVQGPAATPAPSGSTTATPTPAAGGGTPTPTPTPTTAAIDPSTVQCSAIGVKALDIDPLQPFQMSRTIACPGSTGVVNFELVNNDRQPHGLSYKLRGAADSTAKPITDVIDGAGTRDSANVSLPPGKYTLICTIEGHNPMMAVNFTILTKADYIAQGYAG